MSVRKLVRTGPHEGVRDVVRDVSGLSEEPVRKSVRDVSEGEPGRTGGAFKGPLSGRPALTEREWMAQVTDLATLSAGTGCIAGPA
jgi:hypothetical protein